MEVKAVGKFIRVQPRKVRIVADKVRGAPAARTAATLRFHPSKAAQALRKVLESAIANAESNHGLPAEGLKVAKILVDEGPRLKRIQPRAQGRANRIIKKMSHITVVVDELEVEARPKVKTTKPKPRPSFGDKKAKPKAKAKAEAPTAEAALAQAQETPAAEPEAESAPLEEDAGAEARQEEAEAAEAPNSEAEPVEGEVGGEREEAEENSSPEAGAESDEKKETE
jgi:large subunit ribosomal protein L22